MNLKTKNIFISRDVIFHEEYFYFLDKSNISQNLFPVTISSSSNFDIPDAPTNSNFSLYLSEPESDYLSSHSTFPITDPTMPTSDSTKSVLHSLVSISSPSPTSIEDCTSPRLN